MDGPLLKYRRALSVLRALASDVERAWPPLKLWPVSATTSANGREVVFHLGDLPSTDTTWALMAGEVLFNLRSSLDHLAYQLHVRHFRGQVPLPSGEGQTQFPIYERESDWNRFFGRIKNLSRRDQIALRHLQPFKQQGDQWAESRLWLGHLNILHNFDKHRRLHVVVSSQNVAFDTGTWFPKEYGFTSTPNWGPKETASDVDHWSFVKAPRSLGNHPGVFLQVTLEWDQTFSELVPFLNSAFNATGDVLRRFSDRFPAVVIPDRIAPLVRTLPDVMSPIGH
jgi:hypothetical protein